MNTLEPAGFPLMAGRTHPPDSFRLAPSTFTTKGQADIGIMKLKLFTCFASEFADDGTKRGASCLYNKVVDTDCKQCIVIDERTNEMKLNELLKEITPLPYRVSGPIEGLNLRHILSKDGYKLAVQCRCWLYRWIKPLTH